MNFWSFVLFLFIHVENHLYHCEVIEIQYSKKIESEHKHDGFAIGLATATRKLAILASTSHNGPPGMVYVSYDKNKKKLTPPPGSSYNSLIDMNEEFIVVAGQNPECVYIYQSSQPFALKATIPLGDNHELRNVKITGKNTIAIMDFQFYGSYDCFVLLYKYDGYDSWHLSQKLTVNCLIMSITGLAISESHLVVQNTKGKTQMPVSLDVYSKIEGIWKKQQTIGPFGERAVELVMLIDMDDEKLVVYASEDSRFGREIIFTYHLDHTTGKWINDTVFHTPGMFSIPAIKNDTLVVAINDERQPEVCGMVYKLSKATNNGDKGYTWQQVATLKTNGDPLKYAIYGVHRSISIEGGVVYTGRYMDERRDEVGKVFFHSIN